MYRHIIKFPDSYGVYLIGAPEHLKPCVVAGHPPDADLWVTVENGPAKRYEDSWIHDWSLEIELPHGGLLEEYDVHPYQAPEGGYRRRFFLPMVSSDPGWKREVNQGFYIQLRDGKVFGHILVHAMITTDGNVAIDGFINPSGSRNLQPGGGYVNR